MELAHEELREALSFEPDNPPLLHLLSACLYHLGESSEAEEVARRLISVDPHDSNGYGALSRALSAQRRYEEALLQIETAIELAPEHAPYHTFAGKMCICLSQWNRAFEHVNRSLSLESENPDALLVKAWCFFLTRERERARELLQQVLEIDPEHSRARSLLGRIEMSLGEYNHAESHYHAALEVEPESVLAQSGLNEAQERKLAREKYESRGNVFYHLERQAQKAAARSKQTVDEEPPIQVSPERRPPNTLNLPEMFRAAANWFRNRTGNKALGSDPKRSRPLHSERRSTTI